MLIKQKKRKMLKELKKEKIKMKSLKGDQPKIKECKKWGPVTVIHKDKLVLLQSTSSHSVSSNFGNQFLNIYPNVSLIGYMFHDNTMAEFTSFDIKIEHETKQQLPKHSAKPFDQVARAEFDQKEILFQMMRENKSYEKRRDDMMIKGGSSPSCWTRQGTAFYFSNNFSTTLSLNKKSTGKSVQSEETVFEAADTDILLNSRRLLRKSIYDEPEQSWLNDLANPEKPPLTFDELMSTPIDFFAFSMNHLKISKLTKADLVGGAGGIGGTCKSFVELEYNIEECYQALSDQTRLGTNLKEIIVTMTTVKPVHLHESRGRLTIPIDFFFINDLEYRRTESIRHQQLRQRLQRISHWGPKRQRFYGHLINREVVFRRADQKLYKFIEGDFPRLHLNDIEDMLLLVVQNRLNNLEDDVIFNLAVALRMYTRRIVIQKRVKDLQLGVESY
ncbi:hypothetical protein Tco_1576742 [Tanacetum coccineum]